MDPQSIKFISAAITAFSMCGVSIALGYLVSTWLSAISRNPGATPQLQLAGFIGVALTEAIALFALVVSLLILFS